MMKAIQFTLRGAITGARLSLPLLIAVFSYGMVFGVLGREAGMTPGESMLMSGLVFAGSSQFASLDFWNPPLPVITIILTTLAVNLRYVLMGAALRPWFQSLPSLKIYGSLFVMGDESWALAQRDFHSGGNNAALMLGSGAAQWIGWVGSTMIGHSLGSLISEPERWGLDFVFAATFAALLVGMWKTKSDLLPWTVAAVVSLITSFLLPGKWYILIGGLAGSLTGAAGAKDAS